MIQFLAMFTMFIDHLGVLLGCEKFRLLGRLAMPFYCFCVWYSFSRTKKPVLYLRRLVGLAIISQVSFTFFFRSDSFKLNIIFAWLLCCLLFWVRDNKRDFIICLIAVVGILLIVPIEYGLLTLPWFFFWEYLHQYKCKKTNIKKAILMLFCIITLSLMYQYQLFSLLSIPIVALFIYKDFNPRLPYRMRYIWRYFYPLQFALLGVFR